MGGTGNLRTLRNQSGTVGSRTLGSILASSSGAGSGSFKRVYGYFRRTRPDENALTIILGEVSPVVVTRLNMFK
jgi:hypothetical protein